MKREAIGSAPILSAPSFALFAASLSATYLRRWRLARIFALVPSRPVRPSARARLALPSRTTPRRWCLAAPRLFAQESVAEAERQRDSLQSTVSLSHIRFTLLEDYRAPFRISLADSFLQIRNALADGVGAIFSTLSVVLSTLLAYGLPLLFWLTLFFFPSRIIWRRFHRTPASPATA